MDDPIDANPESLDPDVVAAKERDRDDVLADEDLHDLVDAVEEHGKGKTSSFNDVFC